jgi:hypothetical protein
MNVNVCNTQTRLPTSRLLRRLVVTGKYHSEMLVYVFRKYRGPFNLLLYRFMCVFVGIKTTGASTSRIMSMWFRDLMIIGLIVSPIIRCNSTVHRHQVATTVLRIKEVCSKRELMTGRECFDILRGSCNCIAACSSSKKQQFY